MTSIQRKQILEESQQLIQTHSHVFYFWFL